MKRRNFLKSSTLASTSLFVPSFLQAYNGKRMSSRSGKILVVLQLSGGNDGLNTVIPYEDDLYYTNRPLLAIEKNSVIKASNDLGFNPNMTAFKSLYDEGIMSIINSVGYPNPNRSHFRSMDIWHTASDSKEYLKTGWLGRYLDNACQACDKPYSAIEVDDTLSLAMKGEVRSGFAMNKPAQLKRTADNRFLKVVANERARKVEDDNLSYLYKTMVDTQSSADYLFQQSKVYRSTVQYPDSAFAKDLKQIAELITADTDTKIYYASLTGFDTHANQKNKQGKLLKRYSEALQAFVKDLKQNNLFDDTLIMTFSEFGRRVKQNASGGTDHGTANSVFFTGGKLKSTGFYNSTPSLSNLENEDLVFDVDFRRIYANVLEDWLEVDMQKVLSRRFDKLNVI